MKLILSVVLLALTPLAAFSQSVKLPVEVKGGVGTFIEVPADTKDGYVSWLALDSGLNVFPTRLLKDTKTAVVTASAPGRYRLSCVTALGDKPSEFATTTVVVGNPPIPPVPPGPEPPIPPVPPTPTGLKVLIVYETADLSKMPAMQRLIINSTIVREYLDAKCIKDEQGRGWNIWDKDTDPSSTTQFWKDAMKKSPGVVPRIVINDYVGPLPSSVDETLTLLKKYGG